MFLLYKYIIYFIQYLQILQIFIYLKRFIFEFNEQYRFFKF